MSERGGFVGGTRLVCGFLRGNEVNGTSTLFTDSPSSRSFRRAQRKRAKISCKQKEKNVEMKGGITRTFTGKQAQSGNSEKSTSGRQKRKKKKKLPHLGKSLRCSHQKHCRLVHKDVAGRTTWRQKVTFV